MSTVGHTMKLLEAKIVDGTVDETRDAQIAALEQQIRDLHREVRNANAAAQLVKVNAESSLGELRRQLSPLYRALQQIFGELDAAGVEDSAGSSANANPRVAAVWDAWKQKLPPACGKIIDALLVHGELNSAQLRVACRLGTSTVTDAIYKLNKAGLINKNGGRFSLKQL